MDLIHGVIRSGDDDDDGGGGEEGQKESLEDFSVRRAKRRRVEIDDDDEDDGGLHKDLPSPRSSLDEPEQEDSAAAQHGTERRLLNLQTRNRNFSQRYKTPAESQQHPTKGASFNPPPRFTTPRQPPRRSQPATDTTPLVPRPRPHFLYPSASAALPGSLPPQPQAQTPTAQAPQTSTSKPPAFSFSHPPPPAAANPPGSALPSTGSQPPLFLPEIFSPHRRHRGSSNRDRFTPHGWASQVRNWIIEAGPRAPTDSSLGVGAAESASNLVSAPGPGSVVRITQASTALRGGSFAGMAVVQAVKVGAHAKGRADETSIVLVGGGGNDSGGGADEFWEGSAQQNGLVKAGMLVKLGSLSWTVELEDDVLVGDDDDDDNDDDEGGGHESGREGRGDRKDAGNEVQHTQTATVAVFVDWKVL